ncbi:STAS/SEC14 domain-containing protein [Flavobacterium hercynium]|uniref:STAS/SEC14 domain-containing protein n=1 Tax=Flavobacterium hercynium TaxID=387094 RepID=A0A226GZP1_9FLAO|nr:STAS/SEC14 domain-containing protein [Flavobacterium hercynium]OXA86901.1 STAS/SEC14 domain-containing protein [Flavobacterium hercynium]SMP37121.1 SpoIIAA-like [Flavobacterium hercynium]
MIHKIETAENIVAFRALGQVTTDDFKMVVLPELEGLSKGINGINFLFALDTDSQDLTNNSWLQDSLTGLKQFANWKRFAIVSDDEVSISNGFTFNESGEFRGFKKQAFNKALKWVEGSTNNV